MYSAGTSFVALMWICTSINPGITYMPLPSITRSGAFSSFPLAVPSSERLRAIASTAAIRSMRFPLTKIFTGPKAGAPEPSMTVTSRISREPYGPVSSAVPAVCGHAHGAKIKTAAQIIVPTQVIRWASDTVFGMKVFSWTKPARLISLRLEVQHSFVLKSPAASLTRYCERRYKGSRRQLWKTEEIVNRLLTEGDGLRILLGL